MNNKKELPVHWNFALVAALHRLEELIFDFDNITSNIKFVQSGLPNPDELTLIIDSFLKENGLLPKGDQTNLQKMREYVEATVSPIFELGQEAAAKMWAQASKDDLARMVNLNDDQLRPEITKTPAYEQIASASEKRWFIEGFAQRWSEETIDHVKG